MKLSISKTVAVVTPESAENADFDHDQSGFEFEGVPMSFSELVREIKNGGYSELSCYPCTEEEARKCAPWAMTCDPEIDYATGSETSYCLHLDNHEDPRARRYWAKALRYAGVLKA